MVKSKINNLEELLNQSEDKNIEIIKNETTLLTGPGEHYGSIMLALYLKIRKGEKLNESELNIVAKTPPVNELLKKAFDVTVTFKKEVFAYKVTIPALVQFQKEYNIQEKYYQDKLFPKCIGARLSLDANSTDVDENAALLFENLKIQGYITEDRLKGFDLSATKVILKDLAQFHAVPIALKLLKPDVYKEKVEPCTAHNRGLEQLPEHVGIAFHNAIMNGARKSPELQPYLERLQKVVDYGATNPWVLRGSPNEPWGTIAHADFWVSNSMILKDANGTTVKSKIVDLQLMRYWSCCCDLVFFLFTSVINSILDEHFDEFLKIYHDRLIEVLQWFDIDTRKFAWENFLKELDEIAPTELYHVLIMLKPICTERGKVTNSLEEFQDTDWYREDLLGPNHVRKVKDTVFSIMKRGWL